MCTDCQEQIICHITSMMLYGATIKHQAITLGGLQDRNMMIIHIV